MSESTYKTIWCYSPEDHNQKTHRHGNLKVCYWCSCFYYYYCCFYSIISGMSAKTIMHVFPWWLILKILLFTWQSQKQIFSTQNFVIFLAYWWWIFIRVSVSVQLLRKALEINVGIYFSNLQYGKRNSQFLINWISCKHRLNCINLVISSIIISCTFVSSLAAGWSCTIHNYYCTSVLLWGIWNQRYLFLETI